MIPFIFKIESNFTWQSIVPVLIYANNKPKPQHDPRRAIIE